MVEYSKISYVEIFPPIGIARVGDSGFNLTTGKANGPIDWFLSPELPGSPEPPVENGHFRDAKNRIKRQAVRFRVYAYDEHGNVLGELHNGDGYELTWKVHVVNAKGSAPEFRGRLETPATTYRNPDVQPDAKDPDERTDLIVNPGEKIIRRDPSTGDDKGPVQLEGIFYGSRKNDLDKLSPEEKDALKVNLGELRTDDRGRLVFIGGAGYSRCVTKLGDVPFKPDIISEFDNIDWVDDMCDGWVDVSIRKVNSSAIALRARNKATVLSAPPKFAWGIRGPTTLFDIIEDLWNSTKGDGSSKVDWRNSSSTQFYEHIWPVLYATYETSWINEEGYQGHGPMGKGNFLPLEKQLASGSPSSRFLRETVFQRIRKPGYEDPAQAATKFMPRLSGDGGDALEPGATLEGTDPITRFAALTKLQYKRFEDWCDGTFSTSSPFWKHQDGSSYSKLEEAPLADQPWLLTLAALDPTIGDPLYPGIEMYWTAKLQETYKFADACPTNPPFRINHDSIKPGHLGRGLSLPWQSDFSQCNTHWWPSARPDKISSILSWLHIQDEISENDFVKNIVPKRVPWTRGQRITPDYPEEYFPGCTDMVRTWQKLGFVSKHETLIVKDSSGIKLPVYLEHQRMPISPSGPDLLL